MITRGTRARVITRDCPYYGREGTVTEARPGAAGVLILLDGETTPRPLVKSALEHAWGRT